MDIGKNASLSYRYVCADVYICIYIHIYIYFYVYKNMHDVLYSRLRTYTAGDPIRKIVCAVSVSFLKRPGGDGGVTISRPWNIPKYFLSDRAHVQTPTLCHRDSHFQYFSWCCDICGFYRLYIPLQATASFSRFTTETC